MESKKLFFLIQNRMYGDGVRSALGQAVENHYAYPVFMYEEYPSMSDYVKENIEWIKDMEGEVFTVAESAPEGVEMTTITLEELGEKMREADQIIAYGLPKQSHTPPPACSE